MTRPLLLAAALVVAIATGQARADDILDAIDQSRKAYQAGDLATAKQSLDLASQLIAQKNAESFATLLPEPLAGWKADKAQTNAVGTAVFGGVSAASRTYSNDKGDTVDISISGDSALLMQFGPVLSNPAMAGALGKLIRIGDQRAVQNQDGDLMMVVGNKVLINVQGSADAATKIAYAKAIDVAKLGKL
ncbi:hypothetical protein [Pseudolabrys sp. Root1462]|jgi:hypothetical protein|uniref:hypothetical protein n=1 Tax=Pseudolabrys sp. Root1462 TaxID=1736466 RepID=UPI0012E3AD60|nr:hypothetical protein [Pseudolabrys sp. Root1462]